MKKVLLIGDSGSCDLGLGESLIRTYSTYFPNGGPLLKVMAFSNAQPHDFTIGNRVARWGNYMKFSDGKTPTPVQGLITEIYCYPHVQALLKFDDGPADFVFVQLGTNCLPLSSSNRIEQFQDLLSMIKKTAPNAVVYCITPPNNRFHDKSHSDKLDADMVYVFGTDHSIITRMIPGMTPDDADGWPNRDQEHFKICPLAWRDAVADKIKSL